MGGSFKLKNKIKIKLEPGNFKPREKFLNYV
jgi:hypothetical protein